MIKAVNKFILNTDKTDTQNVMWNMVATMSNSFQSMLIMWILTFCGDVDGASYIAIGFAVANLLMTIGKFGIRNYQVTDVQEKYSFSTYFYSRIVTVSFMCVICVVYGIYKYIFGAYSLYKFLVVELLCIYKLIEALEDVFHGNLQQKGFLCIGAKIWSTRNIMFIAEFIVIYIICKNTLITLAIDVATTAFLAVVLNAIPIKQYVKKEKKSLEDVKTLNISCVPIAVATFLLMYISNAPKYTIDSIVTNDEQTKINILLMVIYVVTLLSNFIFNPTINKLAVMYNQKEYSALTKKIKNICLVVIGIVAAGMIFAEIVGRKLLGCIYNVSLEEYRKELLLILISGGLIALINFFYMIIIMLRKQKAFYVIFSVATVILCILGKKVLITFELIGLCLFYNIVLFFVVVCLIGIYFYSMSKKIRSIYD